MIHLFTIVFFIQTQSREQFKNKQPFESLKKSQNTILPFCLQPDPKFFSFPYIQSPNSVLNVDEYFFDNFEDEEFFVFDTFPRYLVIYSFIV